MIKYSLDFSGSTVHLRHSRDDFSSTPRKTVERGAEQLGVDLGGSEASEEQVSNRVSGLGALMGYATGLGVGGVHGLLRPKLGGVRSWAAGLGSGLLAMAASNIPMTTLGVTDPREWSGTSWAMDVIPHLAYGLVTATVDDTFAESRAPS